MNDTEKKSYKLTREEISTNIREQVEEAAKEFRTGFEFIERYPERVTFFGSARALPESIHYKTAEELASKIADELGYTVVTGGGPGIMEAANKGAREGGARHPKEKTITVGLAIGLPREQSINKYADDVITFGHFYARKTILSFAAEAYVFFPGGFGTFDELFSVLTLIQTHKIPRVPVILMGTDFWKPLTEFIKTHMYENHSAVAKGDLHIYHLTDNIHEAFEIIKKAPLADWWKDAD